jgi:hypothetical protein
MTDRHISSSFWTHNKHALLLKLGAAGLPADKILRDDSKCLQTWCDGAHNTFRTCVPAGQNSGKHS